MSTPDVGHAAPAFAANATDDTHISRESLSGRWFVIYFYPKDNTPGCTLEGQDFRDLYPQFQAQGAEVIGVSRDSLKSHANFRTKHDLPFPLLSDPDESVCKAFDVIKVKKMYGRESLGVERSTFLVDDAGVIRKAWRGVKVKGHAAEVLEALTALKAGA